MEYIIGECGGNYNITCRNRLKSINHDNIG